MKSLQVIGLAVMMLFLLAAPAFAADHPTVLSGAAAGAGFGAGLIMIGAGLGFGRIGASALESMARQPEVAGRVLPTMIVIAALLEGATFFALFICYTVATQAKDVIGSM
jgi:F-type H+-transporting ATPase subunit c